MSAQRHLPAVLTTVSVLALAAASTSLRAETEDSPADEPYAPLILQTPSLASQGQSDANGLARLGLAYTSDDNFMFGQYNGLSDDGVTVIGDLRWLDFSDPDSYWQVSLSDMGLDTREGELTWAQREGIKVTLGFDSQQQVRNDSGATPFSGDYNQTLPADWVSGINTGDFANLQGALSGFDRELDRDRFYINATSPLGESWRISSNLSYEEKEGHGDVGAGIYINGASADSVLLRDPVDYSTTEFDIGLAYAGTKLHLDGLLAYSEFDNDEDVLVWQNPYSSFGSRVRYPNGTGGLGLAPDNEQVSGRLTGHYIFSSTTRLQFDGSYAIATQDQDYLDYTVNEALVVTEPVPRQDLDGEVATSTLNAKLLMRPWRKLSLEAFYTLRDRDYDVDRDGYLYVRGDGDDQPPARETVYNTANGLTTWTAGVEGHYPLPMRSRLSVEYAYIEEERENAAVEQTEEDRYTVTYRIRPWDNVTTRVALQFADRAADTYEWAQSYFALLDTELINATPDTQRYINHPQLMQYYMANRERYEAKADISYLPDDRWSLSLNTLWRYDDYDQTSLGLTETEWMRAQFTAGFAASETLNVSAWLGYDRYDANQDGRSFNGGQEKNAFEIFPPLPQASDPQQNWYLDAEDHSITAGIGLQWQPRGDIDIALDYYYVDTRAEQALNTRSGGSIAASDLPDVETRMHHLEATGTWHFRDNLSFELAYQYYTYESDDWAWDDVEPTTIDKVLTFGQDNPDEDIHYVGASVIYRWQ
ncbi:MAG: MtrB/PioB family decaheme-associated outer membrane protein [Halioglobus sp.]